MTPPPPPPTPTPGLTGRKLQVYDPDDMDTSGFSVLWDVLIARKSQSF